MELRGEVLDCNCLIHRYFVVVQPKELKEFEPCFCPSSLKSNMKRKSY